MGVEVPEEYGGTGADAISRASAKSSSGTIAAPVEQRIGKQGTGFHIAMVVLDSGRIAIAAQALGIAQAAYDAALHYSRQRSAFGRSIGSFQAIQAKIADMKMCIEASRLLIHKAA